MMYQRTDLTLSMFYASSADADGNKVATLTMQVIAAEVGAVQTSQLLCITDSAKKKRIPWASNLSVMVPIRCWSRLRITGARVRMSWLKD